MARFAPQRMLFGPRPADAELGEVEGEGKADDGEGLPDPRKIAIARRRMAGIKEASAILDVLPAAGESTHVLATARMDLTDVVNHLLSRLGRCERMRIATLGFNRPNLVTMLAWLDGGLVGSLDLLTSNYHKAVKRDLWSETCSSFRERAQRCAACYSHAKVITLHFASGAKYAMEGSANLCGNGSGREQFCLVNHADLHDWHGAWMADMMTRQLGKEARAGDAEAEEG